MNRKKGIIIGTTGIIIVALALIGFTYGFYLSLISGNESSKKVKVTAGKSKLEYVELSTEVDTIIGPGYTNTKYFAVQNVGDISGSYYLYLVDVENTFIRKNDIVYTIYRKLYDYSEENVEPEEFDINGTYDFSSWENVTNSHCKTVSEFTDYGDCQYPSEKSQLSTQKQTIMEKDDYYVYAFVVTYINQPDIDQIDDEESVFSGVVKIYADETGTDVSPFEDGTLANAIYTSALNETNGTKYSPIPLSKPGIESLVENEKTLSTVEDDYGPSYYYRGNVENNYLNFANKCWRIVRINGDGSIKLLLEDKDNECDSQTFNGNWVIGYGYFGADINSNISYINPIEGEYPNMVKAFYDFQNDDLGEYLDDLKSGGWCLGDDSNLSIRLNSEEITLKCYGENLYEFENVANISEKSPMYVGALTAYEILFAGITRDGEIIHNSIYFSMYRDDNNYAFWTLTPYDGSLHQMYVYDDGFDYLPVSGYRDDSIFGGFRPSINLKAKIRFISGNGTQSNPYVVE